MNVPTNQFLLKNKQIFPFQLVLVCNTIPVLINLQLRPTFFVKNSEIKICPIYFFGTDPFTIIYIQYTEKEPIQLLWIFGGTNLQRGNKIN